MAGKQVQVRFCVPDLQKERANCSFNKEEITNIFDGGEHNTETRRKLQNIIFSDPNLQDPIPPDYMSHEQRYENELRKAVYVMKKFMTDPQLQDIGGGPEAIKWMYNSILRHAIHKDGNPLMLHFGMFLGAIMGQMSEEQQAEWLPKAMSGEIIGTYTQTELGHGTFLRGLETTATYDPVTDEFIIHSPTITATKWWPGGLGKTSSFAVVMAQLHIRGQNYGPHPFVVQLREHVTHASRPGITVGEIGPRLGLNSNDNGFLRFDNVRIPRTNMVMKHSKVLKDGTYVKPKSAKLSYGVMVLTRVGICYDVCWQLMRATTIATRYAAVRHQSELEVGEAEPQIIEYQTQQYKVLPMIASVYAIWFAADTLRHTYMEVQKNINKGSDLDLLPELHASSCALKALFSTDVTDGISVMRLGCGGHGYLASSNLPRIYTSTTPSQTYEGENTVLWLQVARFLIKSFREASKGGRLQPSVAYFKNHQTQTRRITDLSNSGLVSGYERSVLSMLEAVAKQLQQYSEEGMRYEHAWNACSVRLVNVAKVHARYIVCDQFVKALAKYEGSSGVRQIMDQLCRLYMIYSVTNDQGILLKSGALTPDQCNLLEEELGELLAALRPEAVNLVDAFDLHDEVLDSTLGAWDGDVYNRLYNEAMKSPLNKVDVPDAYYKYLQPLMKSNL
ncbi:unnamed protein product [Meganyctiphanes norvegica]|uniref:Acyl-coenzyme A oxidase n=1 Tax=Meganyctiphanes norvegica TaxID=48144 RepID=A0AAV2RVM9_MEGNR